MPQAYNIQRFEVNVSSNGQTQTITEVSSMDSAYVRIVGPSLKSSAGQTNSTANAGPDDIGCAAQLTSTTEVTFYKQLTNTVKMMIEVVEYTGPSGGEYEFIVRDRGNITIANGVGSGTSALTGVTDRNDIIPVYQGFVTSEASNSDYEGCTLACHVNASTEIVFSRNNNGTGSPITAYYSAVEYTGTSCNVGHGFSSSHDTIGLTETPVTLNTDSTGVGGSTFDVGDWATAMIMETSMEADTSETGLGDCLIISNPGSTTTTVNIRLGENNARNDGDMYVHVLQINGLVVNRYSNNNYAENNGGATYGATVTVSAANASSTLDQLSLGFSSTTTGTGTAWARGCLHARLLTAQTFDTYVHRSGNNVAVRAEIADFTALTYTETVDPPVSGGQGNVYVGSKEIANIYYQGTLYDKVYVGSTLIKG